MFQAFVLLLGLHAALVAHAVGSQDVAEDKEVRTPTPTPTPPPLTDVEYLEFSDAACTQLMGSYLAFGDGKTCANFSPNTTQHASVVAKRVGNKITTLANYAVNNCTTTIQNIAGPFHSLPSGTCTNSTCTKVAKELSGQFSFCLWEQSETCLRDAINFPTSEKCDSNKYNFGTCYTIQAAQATATFKNASFIAHRAGESNILVFLFPNSTTCTTRYAKYNLTCKSSCQAAVPFEVTSGYTPQGATDWLSGKTNYFLSACSGLETVYVKPSCPEQKEYTKLPLTNTWESALTVCQELNGTLATIESMDLQGRAQQVCSDFGTVDRFNSRCWIGAKWMNGGLRWESGANITITSLLPRVAEPNTCLYLSESGMWVATNCTDDLHALCERSIVDSTFNVLELVQPDWGFPNEPTEEQISMSVVATQQIMTETFALTSSEIQVTVNPQGTTLIQKRKLTILFRCANYELALNIFKYLENADNQRALETAISSRYVKLLPSSEFRVFTVFTPEMAVGTSSSVSPTPSSAPTKSISITPTSSPTHSISRSITRTPSPTTSAERDCNYCDSVMHLTTPPDRCFQGGRLGTNSSTTCLYITLFDIMNDGWSGNHLHIVNNNTNVQIATLTLAEPGVAVYNVCVPEGHYKIFACGGEWAIESRWNITWANRTISGVAMPDCDGDVKHLWTGAYGACQVCGFDSDPLNVLNANDCVSCKSGYEIDVPEGTSDCVGFCVPEGSATRPASRVCAGPCDTCLADFLGGGNSGLKIWQILSLGAGGALICFCTIAYSIRKHETQQRSDFSAFQTQANKQIILRTPERRQSGSRIVKTRVRGTRRQRLRAARLAARANADTQNKSQEDDPLPSPGQVEMTTLGENNKWSVALKKVAADDDSDDDGQYQDFMLYEV